MTLTNKAKNLLQWNREHLVYDSVITNEKIDKFEAILILKFDKKDKIILWHEVYTKLEVSKS